MSFQAYLDNAEKKTGLTPQQIVDLAHARGFDAGTPTADVLAWLAADLGLGSGHGRAVAHVIKNGAAIPATHVGSTGSHRDASTMLRLDGLAARGQD